MGGPRQFSADRLCQLILDQAAGPLAILDLQGRYIHVNPAGCRLIGYALEELLGHVPREFTFPDDDALDREAIDRVIQGRDDSYEVEKRFLGSDGHVVWALVTNSLIRDDDGRPLFFLSQVQDITVRREFERRWQQTVSNAPVGMALIDLEGCFTEVNDRLCAELGYSRDELLGTNFLALTYGADLPAAQEAFADAVEGRQDKVSVERRYRHKDGHPLWVFVRAGVVSDADDRPAYLVVQFDPVGEHLGDRRLAYLALHDTLTGLANRTLLLDRLEQELTELPSGEDEVLAVLLVDLDNLKTINDQYGHAAGDQLLTTTADSLLKAVRAGDTVARLGGDEFVILARLASSSAAEAFRLRIARLLGSEGVTSGELLRPRASVGITTTRAPNVPPEELIAEADQDMYARKKERKASDSL
ncbi:PAS domain S-box protein [Saccharopolyspora cebuensis]|uniref:PAS domain S-box protein n=1 Tax=Saccharopolyspora cebuensis TaxID=418759 RepID=UPI0031E50708